MGIAMFKFNESTEFCVEHNVAKLITGKTLTCPECAKILLDVSRSTADEDQAEKWLEMRTKQAFFPKRHMKCTLKDYNVTLPEQYQAMEACIEFSKSVEQGLSPTLTLVGSTGTGKTHLVCGIGRYILKKKKSVRYITSAEIADAMLASWNRKDQTEESIIQSFAEYDLLIVDEIGLHDSANLAEGKLKSMNDVRRMAVHKVLSKRYDEMKSTIIVSNFNQIALRNWLGDRLWSRIHENGSKLIECTWKDARTGGVA